MSRHRSLLLTGGAIAMVAVLLATSSLLFAAEGEDWHFNGTVIEACSCPMFCQCYFNTEPASHAAHDGSHFCEFNMAYKVNEGHHGDTDLAGVKFWIAGDLGEGWDDGTTDWAIVTFQEGTTPEQKAGVKKALSHIFPVEWNSFEVAPDGDIEWTATEDSAEAKLDGGEKAHTILEKFEGLGGKAALLENVAYFGAPRNSGFKMMPNKIQTWKVGDKAFKYEGTTGFMITVEMASTDVPPPAR